MLDDVVSQIVRARDKYCVLCGESFRLQCGHLFSRVNHSTRWDLNNCFGQCPGCNLRHEHDPVPFYRWFQGKFGMEAFDALYEKHKQKAKFKIFELEKMYEKFKEMNINYG